MSFQSLDFVDKPMAMVGAGTHGRRITLMLATRGAEVRLHDPNEEVRSEGVAFVGANLEPKATKADGGYTGRAAGTATTEEAVPDSADLKQRRVLRDLDAAASPNAIIASNLSIFPGSELIDGVLRPERVLSSHFYMPPRVILVELMSYGKTDPAVIQRIIVVLPKFGLRPLHIQEESVGLIFNRVGAVIKRESLYVLAQGAPPHPKFDEIFKLAIGARVLQKDGSSRACH
ncbi:3-hydroxyacyl-CoA dehydrogenase family protein [Rhizobium sp. NPDC090279]|uniref:3-hydroxyacyl-CoA dehydrogenase family protein n=1 Tax=Rhizobium sp. NPDC090279 TaxID=3364499 RepID=UPI00383A0512